MSAKCPVYGCYVAGWHEHVTSSTPTLQERIAELRRLRSIHGVVTWTQYLDDALLIIDELQRETRELVASLAECRPFVHAGSTASCMIRDRADELLAKHKAEE